MVKNFLICVACVMACVLSSCKREDSVIEELTGGEFQENVSGVSIKVSPISLKCGEEIVIEASCENGAQIPIIVYSETLDIYETLTTPFVWKKNLNDVGRHELEFSMKTSSISVLTSMSVKVRE